MFQLAERLLISIDLPDSDLVLSGGSDPVHFGVEGNLVNGGASVILIHWFLQVGDVPDVEFLVLSSGDDQFTVGGDSEGINVSFVRLELVPDGIIDVPDLEPAVPAHASEKWLNSNTLALIDGAESNLRDPVIVVAGFSGHLAISEGIEESDLLLGSGCEDLSVVRGESDSEDFLLVADESLR